MAWTGSEPCAQPCLQGLESTLSLSLAIMARGAGERTLTAASERLPVPAGVVVSPEEGEGASAEAARAARAALGESWHTREPRGGEEGEAAPAAALAARGGEEHPWRRWATFRLRTEGEELRVLQAAEVAEAAGEPHPALSAPPRAAHPPVAAPLVIPVQVQVFAPAARALPLHAAATAAEPPAFRGRDLPIGPPAANVSASPPTGGSVTGAGRTSAAGGTDRSSRHGGRPTPSTSSLDGSRESWPVTAGTPPRGPPSRIRTSFEVEAVLRQLESQVGLGTCGTRHAIDRSHLTTPTPLPLTPLTPVTPDSPSQDTSDLSCGVELSSQPGLGGTALPRSTSNAGPLLAAQRQASQADAPAAAAAAQELRAPVPHPSAHAPAIVAFASSSAASAAPPTAAADAAAHGAPPLLRPLRPAPIAAAWLPIPPLTQRPHAPALEPDGTQPPPLPSAGYSASGPEERLQSVDLLPLPSHCTTDGGELSSRPDVTLSGCLQPLDVPVAGPGNRPVDRADGVSASVPLSAPAQPLRVNTRPPASARLAARSSSGSHSPAATAAGAASSASAAAAHRAASEREPATASLQHVQHAQHAQDAQHAQHASSSRGALPAAVTAAAVPVSAHTARLAVGSGREPSPSRLRAATAAPAGMAAAPAPVAAAAWHAAAAASGVRWLGGSPRSPAGGPQGVAAAGAGWPGPPLSAMERVGRWAGGAAAPASLRMSAPRAEACLQNTCQLANTI
jgi:hypothetical protein